jgi:hypothetical protein
MSFGVSEASPESRRRFHPNSLYAAAIVLFCALLLLLTEPRFYADTMNYALHIVQHASRHSLPGRDPVWDFGHVLWKPLGYVLWCITG